MQVSDRISSITVMNFRIGTDHFEIALTHAPRSERIYGGQLHSAYFGKVNFKISRNFNKHHINYFPILIKLEANCVKKIGCFFTNKKTFNVSYYPPNENILTLNDISPIHF